IRRSRARTDRLHGWSGSRCRQGREVMDKWNPWKVTALAMALVMAIALVTGLVVANWSGSSLDVAQPASAPPSTRLVQQPRAAHARAARGAGWGGAVAPPAPAPQSARLVQQPRSANARPAPSQTVQAIPSAPAIPTKEVVDACNRYAAAPGGE